MRRKVYFSADVRESVRKALRVAVKFRNTLESLREVEKAIETLALSVFLSTAFF